MYCILSSNLDRKRGTWLKVKFYLAGVRRSLFEPEAESKLDVKLYTKFNREIKSTKTFKIVFNYTKIVLKLVRLFIFPELINGQKFQKLFRVAS